MVPVLIQICKIQWRCPLFLFSTGNTIFGQIWSKTSKLSVYADVGHLDWFKYVEFNGDIHLFRFWPEIPFLGKFGPKIKNCQLRLKFCTETNSNMQNAMALLTFSFFYDIYPFEAKVGQKIKIFSLNWNVLPRINWVCKIHMFDFSPLDQKYPFWANLFWKMKIVSLCWNLVPRIHTF